MGVLQLEVLVPFLLILVVVAFLYASVGHGGASGYLALMALFTFPVLFMKPIALVLNIFVSGVSFWFFRKHQHFKWKLFYPFAISSIPAAFIGGYISVNAGFYKKILGFFLIFAILKMLNVFGDEKEELKENNLVISLLIGACIGLFSGMIGIGGGIILSPVIVLLAWGNMKQAAAVSALFIFVNSISGLIGFTINEGIVPLEVLYFIPVALIGGSLGAIYGSKKYSMNMLKYVLAGVLTIAAVKLFLV
ncbi:sulfite exporter TauE/SafE family protein [Tenacibaculum jejuense]|uniref:Probable membrane transporter protein n=1 Tax=Tenacibaculum jejuense TaxID=584609 RepID=A0A238UF18_9FLAO|nr:sulfite exporter TauE/SafE family protein [Tenacibaculum jejuense]SNR17000.1 Sulfite exporter [Tenacibaculum jejuense]